MTDLVAEFFANGGKVTEVEEGKRGMKREDVSACVTNTRRQKRRDRLKEKTPEAFRRCTQKIFRYPPSPLARDIERAIKKACRKRVRQK